MIDEAAVLKFQDDGVVELKEINIPSNNSIDFNSRKGPENDETALVSNSLSGYAECVESAILVGHTAHEAYNFADETYHAAILAGFSTQEASDFVREQRFGKATLLSTVKVPSSDDDMREKFWIDIGFPKETRWWEIEHQPSAQNENSSGIEDMAMPPQPEPKNQTSARPLGRMVPKHGIVIRPWKGPLPRTRSLATVTLAAFMPPVRIDRSQANLQHDQWTFQNSKAISECRSKSVLIERAKQYGRS